MKEDPAESETAMMEILRAGAELRELSDAPLVELLAHALTLDDRDPVLDVFQGVCDELALLAALGIGAEPDAVVKLIEIGPVLERAARRMDVGIELLRRQPAVRPAGDDPGRPKARPVI